MTGIYLGRAVAIVFFIALPLSPLTATVFAAVMGLLWLSTVPLTNAAMATMFGVKNMSLLGGMVFLAHQVGSFLGGWLGGVIFDRLGSYDLAWAFAVALSLLAAAVNSSIKEAPVQVGAAA